MPRPLSPWLHPSTLRTDYTSTLTLTLTYLDKCQPLHKYTHILDKCQPLNFVSKFSKGRRVVASQNVWYNPRVTSVSYGPIESLHSNVLRRVARGFPVARNPHASPNIFVLLRPLDPNRGTPRTPIFFVANNRVGVPWRRPWSYLQECLLVS